MNEVFYQIDALLLIKLFGLPLSVAAVFAAIVAPVVIAIYQRYGWVDDPLKKLHAKVVHTYPVPRGGGIVIFSALTAGALFFLGVDKHSVGILAGALVLVIVGVLDDVYDMNPYGRLLLGIVAALTVVVAGIGIAFITNPFGQGVIYLNEPQIPIYFMGKLRTIWILADIFAVLWIVWCMNMINWSKGLDGQLPGQVVIAAGVIAILSLRFTEDLTQWSVTILAGITAGAYLGFLPWNMFPQRMMPGYGGGSLAGFLLAVLSILSGAKVATLMIVLAVPMIDAAYVMLTRIRKGKSPVWGDRNHLHHKLLELGWSKRRIAYFYWLVTLVMGIVALQLNSRQKAFTIVVLALVFGAVLLWLNSFITSSRRSDLDNG
jgi:UDP-GlcNAc:undecaprenyl-phosphate/decaprenyl-phosphate GlcNAc-1-phosphate transferase